MTTYTDIIKKMQLILDSCSSRKNGVDDVVFLYGYTEIARSETVGGSGNNIEDMSASPSMFSSFENALKDVLGESTLLKTNSFLKEDESTKKLEGWTLANIQFDEKSFTLVFAGNLDNVAQYGLHQATAISYYNKLLPLVEQYAQTI